MSLYDDFLNIAREAAIKGGRILRENYGKKLNVEFKGEVDLVTEVDHLSEEIIVSTISSTFPDHQIVAEEGTDVESTSPYRWFVDPLDGTTNYAHGFPCFAVSIAVEDSGRIVVGLVYDPLREECFTAIEGRGAYLNGQPISVSDTERLDKALLATGFPYERKKAVDKYIRPFRNFLLHAQEIRRAGAASIDLCYVAAGRLDGFWESKLHPWDIAAGSLIVKEAGGKMSDFKGGKFSIHGEETLASNGKIHEEMVRVLGLE